MPQKNAKARNAKTLRPTGTSAFTLTQDPEQEYPCDPAWDPEETGYPDEARLQMEAQARLNLMWGLNWTEAAEQRKVSLSNEKNKMA